MYGVLRVCSVGMKWRYFCLYIFSTIVLSGIFPCVQIETKMTPRQYWRYGASWKMARAPLSHYLITNWRQPSRCRPQWITYTERSTFGPLHIFCTLFSKQNTWTRTPLGGSIANLQRAEVKAPKPKKGMWHLIKPTNQAYNFDKN